jgi:hypothetical protein
MTAGTFAIRCFGALLSVYVRDVLVSNAALFGTLNSLIGVGMITGTQFLHRAASRVPQQFRVICGLGGMGAAVRPRGAAIGHSQALFRQRRDVGGDRRNRICLAP